MTRPGTGCSSPLSALRKERAYEAGASTAGWHPVAKGLAALGLRCGVQGPPGLSILGQVGQAATELYSMAWFPWPGWGAGPGYRSGLLGPLCTASPLQQPELPAADGTCRNFIHWTLVLYFVCAVWSCGIEADIWAGFPACSVAGHPYPGY